MADKMINIDGTAVIATNGTSSSTNQLTIPSGAIIRRLEEVAEPKNLNDRFAAFIESKRALEVENSRLNAALESLMEGNEREKVAMKKLYDEKLAEVRKQLNEVTVHKAKLKIELNEAIVDNYNLKSEADKFRLQLQESQENLQNEIIARVNSDNVVQTLREKLLLKDEIHKEQMNETRRQMSTSEINGGFKEQYNAELQESLQEIRHQFENQIRSSREEVKLLLDGTMKKERNCLQRENNSLSSALEYSSNRTGLNHLRIKELEKLNAASNAQIVHLESALDQEKTRSAETAHELKTLRRKMKLQLTKHQNLLNVNAALSLELATFNELLCKEQQCPKLEPGAKRYRRDVGLIMDHTVTSSSTGNIEIVEVDSSRKFIKLHNKSDNEMVLLGGWKLIRQTGGNETVHQFDSKVQINAAADLIVWSADSGVFVMPGDILDAQKWIEGDEMKLTLVNCTGKEEAKRVQKKISPRQDEIRQPDEEAEKNAQKCKVM